MMAGFVKKTLKNAHGALVERLCQKAAAVSKNQSPDASFNGSIHSHTGNGTGAGDARVTDGTYVENRPSSQYSGRQVHSQLPQPEPNPYKDASRQQKYTPYRKPVPPAANGPTNSWAGVHQQAPAELQ